MVRAGQEQSVLVEVQEGIPVKGQVLDLGAERFSMRNKASLTACLAGGTVFVNCADINDQDGTWELYLPEGTFDLFYSYVVDGLTPFCVTTHPRPMTIHVDRKTPLENLVFHVDAAARRGRLRVLWSQRPFQQVSLVANVGGCRPPDRSGSARHIARRPTTGRHATCNRFARRWPLRGFGHTGPVLVPRDFQGNQDRTCLSRRLDKPFAGPIRSGSNRHRSPACTLEQPWGAGRRPCGLACRGGQQPAEQLQGA